jgi:hypothetical protein
LIVNKWFVRGAVLFALAFLAVWWFIISDWLVADPRSPRVGLVYTGVVLASSAWHYRALYRFDRMTRRLRKEERAGLAAPGSTTFAANQRFRYLMRGIESIIVLAIGILATLSVYHPSIATNPEYTRLVITYFIGSVALTGYLTIRDLWVLNKVRQLALSKDDDATLYPAHGKDKDDSQVSR